MLQTLVDPANNSYLYNEEPKVYKFQFFADPQTGQGTWMLVDQFEPAS